MRRHAMQRLRPLLQTAAESCQSARTGRQYTTGSCLDAAAPSHSMNPAAAAARTESGLHPSTSGRRLTGITGLPPSSRAFRTRAGAACSSAVHRGDAAATATTGPVRWGVALRPLAASALGQTWSSGDRYLLPHSSAGGARGFASQPIGRITPEGFTEKAWEVRNALLGYAGSCGFSFDFLQNWLQTPLETMRSKWLDARAHIGM